MERVKKLTEALIKIKNTTEKLNNNILNMAVEDFVRNVLEERLLITQKTFILERFALFLEAAMSTQQQDNSDEEYGE